MTEVGEPAGGSSPVTPKLKVLLATLREIWFDSGIALHDLKPGGEEEETKPVLPAGRPHWGDSDTHPAVYVRQGGAGETKALKVKVSWVQKEYDGSAKLTGKSKDGSIIIEGTVSLSGEIGEQLVDCTFQKKPDVVKNYGMGCDLNWELEAAGEHHTLATTLLKLFFLDARPQPLPWIYPKHLLGAVQWATKWADDKAGAEDVFKAIWAQFEGPKLPHDTGFSYWKTKQCAQSLFNVLRPGFASTYGWSCKGIAHLFMECLALHGITCAEVVPWTSYGTRMFLVKNWRFDSAAENTTLNGDFYGGSWVEIPDPPGLRAVQSTGLLFKGLKIDSEKQPGVPAQGQDKAPVGFENHWIVRTQGKLYDTSYGGVHPNDINNYAKESIDGWLIKVDADQYLTAGLRCFAFRNLPLAGHPYALRVTEGSSN